MVLDFGWSAIDPSYLLNGGGFHRYAENISYSFVNAWQVMKLTKFAHIEHIYSMRMFSFPALTLKMLKFRSNILQSQKLHQIRIFVLLFMSVKASYSNFISCFFDLSFG